MRLPTIQGIIKRRILVNFRTDANTVRQILPAPFRPKLNDGRAIAGICLIRLEQMRPKFAPEFVGLSSENAAHRIAVLWDENGATREGVFIPRRDTGSNLNHIVGGTIFPGEAHKATFTVKEIGDEINFAMRSDDQTVAIEFKGKNAEELPKTSVFTSLAAASNFFEPGSLGFSATSGAHRLDGVMLQTKEWRVDALDLSFVRSSFYDDTKIFPSGSIEFDHALIMRNIKHEWHSAPSFELK